MGLFFFHRFRVDGLDFDLVVGWSQDGSRTVRWGVLGSSWGRLGTFLGALGPSLDGLGGLFGRLEKVLAALRGSRALFGRLFWIFGR